MRLLLRFVRLIMVVALISSGVQAEELPREIERIIPQLQNWGNEQILVDAVRAQNDLRMRLDDIKQRDQEWLNKEGLDEGMRQLMSSPAAQKLLALENSDVFYFELFLMDNQGANVAMTNKTSDYWQGDEAKWQESYKDGQGAVHIGEVEFDESAQDYLIQISVPVIEQGKAIGALTVGVNLDLFEAKFNE